MPGFSDKVGWDLDCPQCGKKFRATAAELKDDPQLTCPHCGQAIKIESGGSARKAADALEDLDRAWDNLTKKP